MTQLDDRLAISKVYEESWKYAYQGIVPQDYLESIPEGQWASHIEQADRKNLVMVEDGIIIGTSGFGKSRMDLERLFPFIFCRIIWERGTVDCYCRQLSVN